jgi:hypothetical protein
VSWSPHRPGVFYVVMGWRGAVLVFDVLINDKEPLFTEVRLLACIVHGCYNRTAFVCGTKSLGVHYWRPKTEELAGEVTPPTRLAFASV